MEQWKSIPGYEGLYEASNEGRIRTAYGKTTRSARFPVRHWKQRIMKQKYQDRPSGKCADARVTLWKDGKEKDMACLSARCPCMVRWVSGKNDCKPH